MVTPATPSSRTIDPLSVTVTVSGGAGNPTPTGSVSVGMTGTNVSGALVGGTATVIFPAGTLQQGADTVFANYIPDAIASYAYVDSSGMAPVNVSRVTPTVTVTPSTSSFSTQQAIQVSVSVSGGSGAPPPAGWLTLTCGYFTAQPVNLNSGSTGSITIPAGSFAPGADTISASYAATDNNYNSTTGTSTVTVSAPGNAAFTITGGSLDVAKGFLLASNLTLTVTPTNGFVGTVALTAAITASPAGAQDLPTMRFTSASLDLVGFNAGSSVLSFTTTAATRAGQSIRRALWRAGLLLRRPCWPS